MTPLTLGGWLDRAAGLYAREKAAVGQVAADAHDEALYLLLRTLGLPLDSDARVLAKRLTAAQHRTLEAVLRRRVKDRVPAAYLTKEAWLGGLRFYVDERVIIPRSYFVEIIPRLKGAGPPVLNSVPDDLAGRPCEAFKANERRPERSSGTELRTGGPAPFAIADICTGSGCLAVLLARHFPKAKVDAIDLSAEALEVANINVRAHRLSRRISLYRSDVFDSVPSAAYDVIVSNPPYEPSARCDALPPEFKREPRMALDGGADGMDVIRKIVRQSLPRLKPGGLLLIEVGGLRAAIAKEFAALKPKWLHTEDGADCVCAFGAKDEIRSTKYEVRRTKDEGRSKK